MGGLVLDLSGADHHTQPGPGSGHHFQEELFQCGQQRLVQYVGRLVYAMW